MSAAVVDSRPLDVLLGTWAGVGRGFYPTIEPFEYTEEITFGAIPTKPFLTYQQRTRHRSEDRPLHAEAGYWRWVGDGGGAGWTIEVVLAHPTGIAEILEGTLLARADGFDLELVSRSLGLTATAKLVEATSRRFELRGDTLTYRVAMGAVGQPLQAHLEAELQRR